MELVTEREIIELRDSMSLDELDKQIKETFERMGYVSYRQIFITMGYVHAFNDKWIPPKNI